MSGFRYLGEPWPSGFHSLGQPKRNVGLPKWVRTADFEQGNLTGVGGADSTAGAGAASLAVNAAAAMSGLLGLSVGIPDNQERYVQLTDPSLETQIAVEFFFDPNSLVMANGELFFIFRTLNAGITKAPVQIGLVQVGADKKLRLNGQTDGGGGVSTDVTITDAPQLVKATFVASSAPGANDGYVQLYVNNVLQAQQTGLDNDTLEASRIDVGAFSGIDAGTSGTIYFDRIRWAREF